MEDKTIVFMTLCSKVLATVKEQFKAVESFPIGRLSFDIYKIGEEELKGIRDSHSREIVECALHNNELLVICNDAYYMVISTNVDDVSHLIKEYFNDGDVQFLDVNGHPTTVKI